MSHPKREYSRRHPLHGNAKRRQLCIDNFPPELRERVQTKAKREGRSLRSLLLDYLDAWSKDEVQP